MRFGRRWSSITVWFSLDMLAFASQDSCQEVLYRTKIDFVPCEAFHERRQKLTEKNLKKEMLYYFLKRS